MKVVYDANVFITFFRQPDRRHEFEARTQRPLLFMSSIVAMELQAGCRNQRQEKALESFLKPFKKADRIIAPDYEAFREAGRVLAALGVEGLDVMHRRAITNDVLIAVSAAKAGAVVVTANERDFLRIERHTRMRWTPVSLERSSQSLSQAN